MLPKDLKTRTESDHERERERERETMLSDMKRYIWRAILRRRQHKKTKRKTTDGRECNNSTDLCTLKKKWERGKFREEKSSAETCEENEKKDNTYTESEKQNE